MPRLVLALLLALLAGCSVPTPPQVASPPGVSRSQTDRAVDDFVGVIERVGPVANDLCRARAPRANCNFLIAIDDRPGQEINAFQTVDRRGRPVIVFTLPLLTEARNTDEMAFILGHEAAHHIQGHLQATIANAELGAILMGSLAEAYGYTGETVELAASLGAELGARTFSKEFELAADSLGAEIAWRAGFDPLRGVAFFNRAPDPGDEFLGTHPPNAARQANVARVVAALR